MGVQLDHPEAHKWYRLSSTGGSGAATVSLGLAYRMGEVVPQDDVEAVRWFRLAAEVGYAPAQSLLGMAYAHGEGAPQDYVEAAKWFRLGAEQGRSDAQHLLSLSYLVGSGVPQDPVQALMWSNLSVSEADEAEAERYAEFRGLILSETTSDQIAEAQRLASAWRPKTWEELQAEGCSPS